VTRVRAVDGVAVEMVRVDGGDPAAVMRP